MPQVPIVKGRSIQDAPLQGGFQHTPDVSSGARALAGGLDTAAQVTANIADRIDTAAAYDAETRVKSQWLATDAELRKRHRGVNAPGYAEEADKFWAGAQEGLAGSLSPRARALIGKSLGAARLQAKAGALAYVTQETERAQDEAFTASQMAEVQRAAASGDPAVAAVSSTLLKQRNAQQAALKGWSPEQLDAVNTKATTALHVNLLQGMQAKDPTAALAYFNTNKGEIDGTRHAELEHSLTQAAAGNDGVKAAGAIWEAMGPKADGQPVELDKMAAAAREQFGNDKPRLDATLAQLKEFAAAQTSSERERTAARTNAVMLAYSKGAGLASLMRMPEFTSLPGAEQAKIRQHIEDRSYAYSLRANAAGARADAAEAREQRRREREGFGAYLVYSNPEVLAGMSEAEVQALLPVLGNSATGHLMEKKRSLDKSPLNEAEAKMDTQDFNHIADEMGLKPYAEKSDEEKGALGELQFRVEQLVYQAQQVKGKPLTRAEKSELMRAEMARTVTVGGWFFDDEKAVIQLTKDDLKNVVVPQADRKMIVEALKRSGAAPTEENLRAMYLRGKSRAGSLVTP